MNNVIDRTEGHCSGCGSADFEDIASGSYSGCCNEPVCTPDGCTYRWVMEDDGEHRACCAPAAESATGQHAKYRLH